MQLYKQNPLENFFIISIYPNYTLALMHITCIGYSGILILSIVQNIMEE